MNKKQKRLFYLSGALVGLISLKIYLNKRNQLEKENIDSLKDSRDLEERKYTVIKTYKNPSK